MPRSSRVVIPGVAHHVTQRGNRRMQTFFCEADYAAYRAWVAEGCMVAGVEILAYCLMPNHVHFIVVPAHPDALRFALAGAHRRYTSLINKRQRWQGHLWQERFHSFPMDDEHLIAAVRYVELNPVRARLAATPQAWKWSSAAAHMQGKSDGLVAAVLPPPLDRVGPWVDYLNEKPCAETGGQIQDHSLSGKPLGSGGFVARLEALTGRTLQVRPRGRPANEFPGGQNRNCPL
ncbi:MAG: transposase [Hyphomicrobiaceae bacterium]